MCHLGEKQRQQKHKEMSKMIKQVQETIAKADEWTDEDFPTQFTSIYQADIDANPKKFEHFKHFDWKSGSDSFESPKVFNYMVKPNDVIQRALGDCYFLATLSSLADHKDLIGHLYETKECNKAKVYLLKFYINGYLTPVIVNERVPAMTLTDGSEATAFAGRPNGELWVSILEKAWAKLHGTYARAEIGFVPFAFNHLTGAPCKQYLHDDITTSYRNQWWSKLKKYAQMQYIMMSSSKEKN